MTRTTEEVQALYDELGTQYKVARRLGRSTADIGAYLRALGVVVRPRGRRVQEPKVVCQKEPILAPAPPMCGVCGTPMTDRGPLSALGAFNLWSCPNECKGKQSAIRIRTLPSVQYVPYAPPAPTTEPVGKAQAPPIVIRECRARHLKLNPYFEKFPVPCIKYDMMPRACEACKERYQPQVVRSGSSMGGVVNLVSGAA